MKINIQIEDASPEEAGLIFAGIAVSDAIKRSAANAVDEIVRHKPGPDPTYDEIKQEQAEPAPRKAHNKPNKFGIPASLFSTDNKAYSAAWAYCNAHGITYDKIEEHKALHKAARAARPKKPCSPHQRVHEAVKNAPPAAVVHRTIRDWQRVVNGPIMVGAKVKHNGQKSSPFFGEIGEIAKVGNPNNQRSDQFLVNFGGSTIWLPQSSIFVVKERT